jgi:hypothetical protein
MDAELATLHAKLADLQAKLEEANQRKMPSVTNEWIVTECRKSVNKIERDEQLFLDTHKVILAAAEERIMDCRLIIPPNESIMTPLSRAIMADPKGPWRVQYQLWDGTNMAIALPPSKSDDNGVMQRHREDFVKKMVKKHHSEMLKNTFPTATWECGVPSLWVTFPNPVDSMEEYKEPLLS